MRLLHYPPQRASEFAEDGSVIGIGAHTEYVLSTRDFRFFRPGTNDDPFDSASGCRLPIALH
jgi:hypothetical protein